MTVTAGLADGQCGLTDGQTYGDWRVPTKTEWEDFVCQQYFEQALCDTVGTGQITEYNPFYNLGHTSINYYQTGTKDPYDYPYTMHVPTGHISLGHSTEEYYVWPVRDP